MSGKFQHAIFTDVGDRPVNEDSVGVFHNGKNNCYMSVLTEKRDVGLLNRMEFERESTRNSADRSVHTGPSHRRRQGD